MAPTMQMHRDASPALYTPESDAADRHEYGVCKSRKQAVAGSGRAWSDDEEVYLLQTRLQKMPYKHIAAHLKKTELACRLHYHQLSHGSNRRRRTTSVSSCSSSTGGRSPPPPMLHAAAIPSPIHEHAASAAAAAAAATPTPTPSQSPDIHNHEVYGHGGGVRLPSIHHHHHHHHGGDVGASACSPPLPAILPKPATTMRMLALSSTGPAAAAAAVAASSDGSDAATALPLLPAATFTTMRTPAGSVSPPPCTGTGTTPHLRLDCNVLPRIQSLHDAAAASETARARSSSSGSVVTVDRARLQAAYGVHRAAFWATVAAEYGYGAEPAVLEQAWWMGMPVAGRPLTPATPPDDEGVFCRVKEAQAQAQSQAQASSQGQGQVQQDKTRIASILGIDANPRSPKERELVRRLEEERGGVLLVV